MVSSKAKDKLGLFMAAGIAIMLGLQVIVNVAVVTASSRQQVLHCHSLAMAVHRYGCSWHLWA